MPQARDLDRRRTRALPIHAVALAAWLSACEGEGNSSTAATSSTASPTTTSVRQLGELAIQQDYAMSVESLRECPSPPGFEPPSGYRRLGVEVVIEGRTERQVPANSFYAQALDAEEERYESLLNGCTPVLDAVILSREKTARGWITFEVPKSAQRLELVYAPPIIGSERQAARFALGR